MLSEKDQKLIQQTKLTSQECPLSCCIRPILEIVDKLVQEIEEKERAQSCSGCKWDDERWHAKCFQCRRMGNDVDGYEAKE